MRRYRSCSYTEPSLLNNLSHIVKTISRTFLLALVALGLPTAAMANLVLIDTYKDTPEDTPHILSVAAGYLGADPGTLESLLRIDLPHSDVTGNPFTVTFTEVDTASGGNTNNAANISWNLAGTGEVLLGVYVFGGSNGANLYQITDTAQLTSGSATVTTPITGGSGKYATISHILFLGAPAAPQQQGTVPDGGSTVALLGGALAALGMAKRKFVIG